jgi:hypothetical protein
MKKALLGVALVTWLPKKDASKIAVACACCGSKSIECFAMEKYYISQ